MGLSKLTTFIAAGVVALAASAAQAVPITGLYNTGVDASGDALAGGNGVADPHYVVQASTLGLITDVPAVTYFNPAYAAEDANSRWISHSATGTPGNGITIFRTSFTLDAALDPETAEISGLWGVDNIGAIWLNGVSAGISHAGFASLVSFSITDGFVAGLNTIDFVITDQGPPLAFRVDDIRGNAELLGNGTTPQVSEPGLIGLFAAGLLALGIRRRRT